jgi:hypothetical protein
MVDHVDYILVRRPLLGGKARRGVWVAGPQAGPPVAFQPFLEGLGIERADDVAAHAFAVFGHEGQRRLEQAVGGCEKVPEQLGVVVNRGGILAFVAGEQADPVQGVKVAGAVRADPGSGAIHRAPPFPLVPGPGSMFLSWLPG